MKNIFIIWVSTALSCFAADTNIDYAAIPAENVKEDAPNMILSNDTNSLRSGVWINNSNHVIVVQNGKMISAATLAMLNTTTNMVTFWWSWPSTELQYAIKMVDEQGHEIPKTSYGKNFDRAPKRNPDNMPASNMQKFGLHLAGVPARGDNLYSFDHFDPIKFLPKCFELGKPGNYKLTLTHHVYFVESRTNGHFLRPVTFSPVTMNVRVEKSVDK